MRRVAAPALVALSLLVGCGGDSSAEAPPDPVAAAERELPPVPEGLPPELAELRSQAGELLDGGSDAFEARIDALEGTPVVVNKWASWCAPCRSEFPLFREQALELQGEVAFLGVDSIDEDAAAAEFLAETPVPYPSFRDPDLEVAEVFGGVAFPVTAFYDAEGELAYVKQGEYATEEQLAEDIERYARG